MGSTTHGLKLYHHDHPSTCTWPAPTSPGIGSGESAKEFAEQLGLPAEIVFGDEEAESYKNLRFVNSDFSEEPATAGKIPFSYGCFCFMRCRGYSLSKEGQTSKIMFTLESQRSWQEQTSWRKTKIIKKDDDDHDVNGSVHPDADAHARSEFRCSEFSSVFISVAIVWWCLMFSLANLMFDQFSYHAISISRYSRRYSIRTAASAACAWWRSARRRRWRAGPMGDLWVSALTLLMGREGCGACGLEMLFLYFCLFFLLNLDTPYR